MSLKIGDSIKLRRKADGVEVTGTIRQLAIDCTTDELVATVELEDKLVEVVLADVVPAQTNTGAEK